ncbi:MAG: hypothetical protein SO065_02660, partial [Lawsonibacter sp.]|nr:hypothetical protein [Lawsonibacter sp.]
MLLHVGGSIFDGAALCAVQVFCPPGKTLAPGEFTSLKHEKLGPQTRPACLGRSCIPEPGATQNSKKTYQGSWRAAASCSSMSGAFLSVLCFASSIKIPEINRFPGFLARQKGIEPPASPLGATSFGSCLVVRHASKCPQTRMNTGFFIELPVAEYLKISPNIGSFC